MSSKAKVGAQVWSGSQALAEVMASFPFDFVYFDTEHTPYDSSEAIAGLIRAIESRGNAAWARVRANDPLLIGRLVELGIEGIAVPHVNTGEEAARAVAATRVPPRGVRGFCPNVRRYDYGSLASADVEGANDAQVFAMIEDFAAMPNLDDILAADVTGVFPGLADMSWTSPDPAVHGKWDHPAMREAFEEIVTRAKAAGKQVMAATGYLTGPGVDTAAAIKQWQDQGVDVFTLSSDLSVMNGWCRSMVRDLGLDAD